MGGGSAARRPSRFGGAGPRGVFVTGTGTEVGKTVVAGAIARTLAARGERVAVFKPAVTGLADFAGGAGAVDGPVSRAGEAGGAPVDGLSPEVDEYAGGPAAGPAGGPADDSHSHTAGRNANHRQDHEALRVAAGSEQGDEEIAPYRYAPPMSPHLAAALAGEEISPERLLAAARAAADGADALVCEGVGGLLVPLAPDYLVRDFAVALGLPLVVAAPPGLGTINHTLLTLEAARAAGLEVAAVVLTPWPELPDEIERSNRETIASLGEVQVQLLPHLDLDEPETWPALTV
jgi:dethiobiotin synthetase